MTALRIQVDHCDERGFRLQVDADIALTGVTALFGPSGSGKTSLLDLVAGLRRDLDQAQVSLGDTTWQNHGHYTPACDRQIGYVFQDARLFPHLTVAGNLAYANRRATGAQFTTAQVIQWLGLEQLLDAQPHTLSAGQKQRAAIGRALLRGPRLLLLDEPLANLDRVAADELMERLSLIAREARIPMIYVSHQLEEISNIADHIIMLENGQIAAQGPLLDLAGRLDSRLADDESAAAILRVDVGAQDKEYGLCELRVDGRSIWVSATHVHGDQRRLRVPARDVSLCREQPAASSILNILPATIAALRDTGSAHCLVRMSLREQHLLARITRRSRDELKLKVGDAVFAQIKSTALLGDPGPMSGHPFDVLTPDTLIDAVESAGYVSDARFLALNSYENRVYQVGIEDSDPLIAKFYRPERWSEAQIREEHAFSMELAEAEIPVVAPLANKLGETVHRHGKLLFALFPRRGGHAPEFDNPDNLLVLGRTLGRIHAVGASKPFVHRPAIDGQQIIDESRSLLPHNFISDDLCTPYLSLLDDIEGALMPLFREIEGSDMIRVHGDCHGGNILWRDDTAHFVDLDDCMSAPAIQDLWMFLSGERHEQELQLSDVVAGYEEFFEFPARQLRWVEALRTLRIIRYAAWLARRWDDPAFLKAFTWFASPRYWSDHILELREQYARLQEPPLRLL